MHHWLFISLALVGAAKAAVVYQSQHWLEIEPVYQLDLDGDSIADVVIDARMGAERDFSEPYFLATPLNGARIAANGDIATSFSAGATIQMDALAWVESPDSLKMGGYFTDALGNPIVEGWGGVTFEWDGTPIIPSGGPTYQIDLFLVDMGTGVAWVDVDTSWFGQINPLMKFHWAYLEGNHEVVEITAVPEPSVAMMGLVGVLAVISRRRQTR